MEQKLDRCLESIHRIELTMTRMQQDVEINTYDLSEHIKRTDLLEKKLSKIYQVVLLGAGFAAAHFGPEIIKYIGILI